MYALYAGICPDLAVPNLYLKKCRGLVVHKFCCNCCRGVGVPNLYLKLCRAVVVSICYFNLCPDLMGPQFLSEFFYGV